MMQHKSLKPSQWFAIALSAQLLLVSGLSVQAQSKPDTQRRAITNSSKVSVTFTPPGAAKPDTSAGGASRSGTLCGQDRIGEGPAAMALTPARYDALTAVERPTFFAYVPETSARKAFFSLMDEQGNSHFQTTVAITGKAGVISVNLPSTAPALETGKSYKWSFAVMCGNTLRPDSPTVEGRVQRTTLDPTLKSQLDRSSLLEQAALYGKGGMWYDTLAAVAELRRSQPDDTALAKTWTDLLTSVGLDAIATQPLL